MEEDELPPGLLGGAAGAPPQAAAVGAVNLANMQNDPLSEILEGPGADEWNFRDTNHAKNVIDFFVVH